jgi:hypothetical protein
MTEGDYAYTHVSVVGEAAPGSSRTVTTSYSSSYVTRQPFGWPLAGNALSIMDGLMMLTPPDLAANLSGAVLFTYASPTVCEFAPVPVPPREGRVEVPTAVGDGPCENPAFRWQVL